MNTRPPTDHQPRPPLTISDLALFTEEKIIPFFFAYSIAQHLYFLIEHADKIHAASKNLTGATFRLAALTMVSAALTKVLLIILNALIIAGYLLRRNLKSKPSGWREITVPLAGTFFYLLYNYLPHIPVNLNPQIIPDQSLATATFIGVLLNAIGTTISCIATYHLRHSYALFAQVRDIVSQGIYRYVRHPIYCGYFISTLGFACLSPRLANIIVFSISILLTIYRARIEEHKLLTESAEYRTYAQKVPFILPFKMK